MKGYKLTDRGKIFVTILIILLLAFLLPAVILLFSTIRNSNQQDNPGSQTISSTQPPSSETPPDDGGDSPQTNGSNGEAIGNEPGSANNAGSSNSEENSNGAEIPDNTENGQGENGAQPPPPRGENELDTNAGLLTIYFSPDDSPDLPASTLSLIDSFLDLPGNTAGNLISVQVPQLPHEDFEPLAEIITSALLQRGVPRDRISFISRSAHTGTAEYEITMLYLSSQPK